MNKSILGRALGAFVFMGMVALCGFMGLSTEVRAHGLGYAEVNEAPKAMRFYYSDGSPARFAEAIVHDPDGEEFLIGRTDARGHFAFIPEKAGKWDVEINDGMGHRAVASFNIVDEKSESSTEQGVTLTTHHDDSAHHHNHVAQQTDHTAYSHSKIFMALFGVSILANLGLGITLYRRKKSA